MTWTKDDQRESQRRYYERNRDRLNALRRAQTKERKHLPKALPKPDRLREMFSYDAETGTLTLNQPQGGRLPGSIAGWLHHEGYRCVSVDNHKMPAHRVCWAIHYGSWPDRLVDHIDMDKCNNSISNLRLCNASENGCNRLAPSNNTSGFKGVSFLRRENKYRAVIHKDRRRYEIGLYDTAQAASEAYNRAMEDFHGEFARS